MNTPPPQLWLNALLAAIDHAQRGLLRLWHALGLTGDSHGQPAWPWARRVVGETLLIDLGLARQLLWCLAAIVVAVLAVGLSLAWKRRRLPVLAIGALALVIAPWPSASLVLGPAVPTSFHTSPTNFDVGTIARGEQVYAAHCAACHGADGRGEGPLAQTLTRWPPTIVSPLLGRRADGEMFWHVLDGMRDARGAITMPAFAGELDDRDTWAVLDYMRVLSARTGAIVFGSWPVPLRLPELTVQCGGDAPRSLAAWRGAQRVRVVLADGLADGRRDTLPLEDPRFQTLVVTRDAQPLRDVPQFRAACTAVSPAAWDVFAQIAGIEGKRRIEGTTLLSDRDGWLRARAAAGEDAALLCKAGDGGGTGVRQDLTALVLEMDAEPVRFVKGGFVH